MDRSRRPGYIVVDTQTNKVVAEAWPSAENPGRFHLESRADSPFPLAQSVQDRQHPSYNTGTDKQARDSGRNLQSRIRDPMYAPASSAPPPLPRSQTWWEELAGKDLTSSLPEDEREVAQNVQGILSKVYVRTSTPRLVKLEGVTDSAGHALYAKAWKDTFSGSASIPACARQIGTE